MAAYGGMERHVCLIAGDCAAMGALVRLVTTSNSLNDQWRSELLAKGVEVIEMNVARESTNRLQKLFWLLRVAIIQRATPWDVIYTNGQSGLAQYIWLAGRRTTRIVHHHHTAADEGEQEGWAPSFRRVLRKAPELVACSEATRQAMQNATGRRDVNFLPYRTDEIITKSQVQDRAKAADELLHFGFVGRLVSTKGLETIAAICRMPELESVRWHIHGSGQDYPPHWFSRLPNVEYHGSYTNRTEYAEILKNLDAIVLFSKHNEGMPLSIIEAMSAGLPWIATDRGGTRELACSPENCALIPPDTDALHVVAQVASFANRIRAGETSRIAQREAYDQWLAPSSVSIRWLSYFGLRA